MPVFLGNARLPQPDFSATSFNTPVIREASKSLEKGSGFESGLETWGRLRISRRNSTGSFPAAWASSSMKDWKTKQKALLLGARSAYVGTPSGISDAPKEKFGTNVPGNSLPGILA